MAKPAELIYTSSGLDVRVVASSDGSHAGGLVASVALGAVLKVRIWPTRTVHTNIPCIPGYSELSTAWAQYVA